ncbi:MAG TPA: hypothetical protein VHA33_05880 [Candidatus Angelobacter sp.]|nr:hypothetical protein [Candidatus Angelobacter sp.]
MGDHLAGFDRGPAADWSRHGSPGWVQWATTLPGLIVGLRRIGCSMDHPAGPQWPETVWAKTGSSMGKSRGWIG